MRFTSASWPGRPRAATRSIADDENQCPRAARNRLNQPGMLGYADTSASTISECPSMHRMGLDSIETLRTDRSRRVSSSSLTAPLRRNVTLPHSGRNCVWWTDIGPVAITPMPLARSSAAMDRKGHPCEQSQIPSMRNDQKGTAAGSTSDVQPSAEGLACEPGHGQRADSRQRQHARLDAPVPPAPMSDRHSTHDGADADEPRLPPCNAQQRDGQRVMARVERVKRGSERRYHQEDQRQGQAMDCA